MNFYDYPGFVAETWIATGTLIFKEFATIMSAHFSREGEKYEYS